MLLSNNKIISKNLSHELELIKSYITENKKHIKKDVDTIQKNKLLLSNIEKLLLELDKLQLGELNLNDKYKKQIKDLDIVLLNEEKIYNNEIDRIENKKKDIITSYNEKLKIERLKLLNINLKLRYYKHEKKLLEEKINSYANLQLLNRQKTLSHIMKLNTKKKETKKELIKKKNIIENKLQYYNNNKNNKNKEKLLSLKKSLDSYKFTNHTIGNYKLQKDYKNFKKQRQLLIIEINNNSLHLNKINGNINSLEKLIDNINNDQLILNDINRCEKRFNIIKLRIKNEKNITNTFYTNKLSEIKININDIKNKIANYKKDIVNVNTNNLEKNNQLLDKIKNRKKYLQNILK